MTPGRSPLDRDWTVGRPRLLGEPEPLVPTGVIIVAGAFVAVIVLAFLFGLALGFYALWNVTVGS